MFDDPTNWLSAEFWADIVRGTVEWALQALPRVLLILALGFVVLKLVNLGCKRLMSRAMHEGTEAEEATLREHQKRTETLMGMVRKAAVITVWVLIAMLVLMQVGVNVAPLIAGAGILGLAIGFGAQELVRDVITGFFILFENQLRKGDVAIVNGTAGAVEAMGLRTITLRDLAGTVHVFQNGKISTLSNMTKGWSAMVFDIGVAYKEDTDRVAELMLEVAADVRDDPAFGSKILEPIEVFGVDDFGDNAVIIKARVKTQPGEQWSVGREYRRRLKQAFDANHIEIPFPHRTLYWGEASEPFKIASSQESGSHSPARRLQAAEGARSDPRGNGGRGT